MKKILLLVMLLVAICLLSGCEYELDATQVDQVKTAQVARTMAESQPTPNDITYSLQRYNLIRRAYWMNGMEEKARTLPCEVTKPLGYIYLFLEGVGCVTQYAVDGQITSLNAYLTPDTTEYLNSTSAKWLADVDGTYGENQDAIFFFPTEGE